jgi:hypothetical protein
MYQLSKFRNRLLTLSTLAALGFSVAPRAQSAVDVDITLNGVTILYYYSAIDVNIASAELAKLLTTGIAGCTAAGTAPNDYTSCNAGALASTLQATATAGALSTTNATSPAGATTFTGTTTLTLQNVWAVRAIGGATINTTVAVALGTAPNNKLNNGAASITLTSAAVASGGAPAATVTFADPGLSAARSGDVILGLDLTQATLTGNYSTATAAADPNYTLTITGT